MARIFSVFILTAMMSGSAFGITLSPDQPLDFSFDGLTPSDPPGGIVLDILAYWWPPLGTPKVVTIDFFEDSSDLLPFYTTMAFGHNLYGVTVAIDAWNDLDGRVVVSVSDGIYQIDSLLFGAMVDGQFYGRSYDLTAVPLPPAIVFFISGLLILKRRLP